MATSLADDATHEEWRELGATPEGHPVPTRADALWTLFGLTLLGAFMLFVVAKG